MSYFINHITQAFFKLLSIYCKSLIYFLSLTLIWTSLLEPAYAGNIFENCTCYLKYKLLVGNFPAMITAISGMLAIGLAAIGSFKGAWAVLFVSVFSYIYDDILQMFFPLISCTDPLVKCPGQG